MIREIKLPNFGLTVERAQILTWHKKEGENVDADEALVDVQTDKTMNTVESPYAGTISKILVPEGAEIQVQTVIALIETE